jgi:Fe-S-cluster containining protein
MILEKKLNMKYIAFMETYCRWIPSENGTMRLSLKEKANFDCIFWQNGCSIYEYRPLQCRSFPFWKSNLASSKSWKTAASSCPGINSGTLHPFGVIESWLEQLAGEPVIIREGC